VQNWHLPYPKAIFALRNLPSALAISTFKSVIGNFMPPRLIWIWLFLGAIVTPGLALCQNHSMAWELLKQGYLDSARHAADSEVEQDSLKAKPGRWYARGMVYKALFDKDEEGLRYRGEYVDLTAFDSYKRALELDVRHLYTEGILEDMQALTDDFCRMGLDLYERGYDSRNTYMLTKASRYLDAASAGLTLLGPRQLPVYATLREYGIDKPRLEACRALAKDKSGQNDAAKAIYLDLVRQKSQESAVYLGLKDIYLSERQKGKAIRILEQGKQNVPQNLEIELAYAEVLADTNRSSEGRAIAKALSLSYPTEAAPLVTLGLLEEKRHNPEIAEAYYEEATTKDPSDFMANYRVGKFYYSLSEQGKAKKADPKSVKDYQEKSLWYAEQAALANPKHLANCRILLSLYTDLGLTDKAQLLRTEMN
jgi:hypothetical protein